MCEIFGFTSRKYMILNDYLEEFYSHSNEHPHGWGLALMDKNDCILEKQPIKASDSSYLERILSCNVLAKNLFAHIRLATIGYMDPDNCHPFTKIDDKNRRWTLVHNGTIFYYEPLNQFINLQPGDTDSERILLYLINEINNVENKRDEPLSEREIFILLDLLISDLATHNKLNILLYVGDIMYVHTNLEESLYYLETEDSVMFSTQALSDENWQKVPLNTLYACKNGKFLYKGATHQNEYIETEDDLSFLKSMIPTE